jgi:predicted SprT family Zn-dependent metalloprotease
MTLKEKLNELITEQNGLTKFPTLVGCCICHGMTGVYTRTKGSINDKTLATTIAQIQHGYYLAKWEGRNVANKSIFPFACTCECDHEWGNTRNVGHCLNESTCKKCGTTVTLDSSD